MNIFVGGVNGSGKTTVLDATKMLRPDWRYVKSSQAFMEWLGFPGDYDRLRQLHPDERDGKLSVFMELLLEQGRNGCQIVDSHYLNLKYGKVERIAGDWLRRFDGLVLVTAPIATIMTRLQSDAHLRDRALFADGTPVEQYEAILQSYSKQTEEEFLHFAAAYHLPFCSIENLNKDQAAGQLVAFVENIER